MIGTPTRSKPRGMITAAFQVDRLRLLVLGNDAMNWSNGCRSSVLDVVLNCEHVLDMKRSNDSQGAWFLRCRGEDGHVCAT